MANKVTQIVGFFYQQGSIDFPFNMGVNDKFGFSDVGGTAIFQYSINDVEQTFYKPRLITQPSQANSGLISSLYAEDLLSISGSQVTTTGVEYINFSTSQVGQSWKDFYLFLEWLYNNQDIATNAPDPLAGGGTSPFNSKGDQVLSSPGSILTGRPYSNSVYRSKSIKYTRSTLAGAGDRLAMVEFTVNIDSVDIDCKIYFVPDNFIESNIRTDVYLYTDTEAPANTINENEFDNGIIDKQFNVFAGNNKYKSWDSLSVRRIFPDLSQGMDKFYIYSNISKTDISRYNSIFDIFRKRSIVKNWLTQHNSDINDLRFKYPDLFTTNTVEIIPFVDNTYKDPTTNQITVNHPVSLKKIKTKLVSYGYVMDADDLSFYKPTEVFYVGAGESSTENLKFNYPLLAVEKDADTYVTERPITERFPKYKPLYGVPYSPTSELYQQFHHFLLIVLGLVNKDTVIANIDPITINLIGLKLINGAGTTPGPNYNGRAVYQFEFNTVTWAVYADI